MLRKPKVYRVRDIDFDRIYWYVSYEIKDKLIYFTAPTFEQVRLHCMGIQGFGE